jgi:hypothetical protein
MAPKKHDPLLRFFEAREDYKQHERQVERWLVGVGVGANGELIACCLERLL